MKKSMFLFGVSCGLESSFAIAGALELPVPDDLHSGVTTERSLSGVFLDEHKTFLFTESEQCIVEAKFNLSGKTRDAKFGALTDQKKIELSEAKYPGQWKGAYIGEERVYVWDSTMLQILVLRAKDYKTIYSTTIPVDKIRPAADKMGEPTNKEIQQTRADFKANSRKIFGSKYTGLVEVPKSWFKGDERKFFVTSKIKGFPLMILNCKGDDSATCVLDRQCFLEGKKVKSVAGVGVIEKEKKIILGHPEQHEIGVFKYNSCFDVVHMNTIKLPNRLSKLTDLTVDADSRLVITTKLADQFTNGNVFYWEPEVWNVGAKQ